MYTLRYHVLLERYLYKQLLLRKLASVLARDALGILVLPYRRFHRY